MRRVVVTGLGVVSPVGNDVPTFWANLQAGVSGVRSITAFDASDLPVRIAGSVEGFDPQRTMDRRTAQRSARFVQFAVDAAAQAMAAAGLDSGGPDPYRVGVVLNTGGGGMKDIGEGAEVLRTRGPGRIGPFFVPSLIANMAACQIAIRYGIHGPVTCGVAACASGIYALVEAARYIRAGELDVVIAGGSDAALMRLAFAGLANMGALSRRNDEPQRASRPFDRDRDGFVFSEGAAVLVLEAEEHARARGAGIQAELAGGALTADAYHVTAPEPSGQAAAEAMVRALRAADVSPRDVDYICAHGTGTRLNDVSETLAIRRALGSSADDVAVSSPKSMTGHLLGAAGALSALTSVLAIRDGVIPPTINLDHPDPECDLDYVPLVARRRPVRVAMANGFGFGGQNGVVVFRAYT